MKKLLSIKYNFMCAHIMATLICFTLANTVVAQQLVDGFTFLGKYKEHNYYISHQLYFGKEIKNAVADARAKLNISPSKVYAAAIKDINENLFIQNAVIAYNILKYGGNGKSDFQNWHDPRNPWIGLTDARKEGKFIWSNGQNNCNDFWNWNINEPNNFGTDEDYVQMLIMNPYLMKDGSVNDPVGKWNDWFNQFIANNKKKQTKLPVIVEVGSADCADSNIRTKQKN